MACKFCPKIRKTDWIFILIAALGFYAVNKLGYVPQFTPTSKISRPLPHPIEKPNNMTEEERKKHFIELQKECLLHKDKKACEEVF
ncbi:valine--tRNA ligase [Helicobacter pylori]|nr:valine--tRNA ligase [Helicobacter pylori]